MRELDKKWLSWYTPVKDRQGSEDDKLPEQLFDRRSQLNKYSSDKCSKMGFSFSVTKGQFCKVEVMMLLTLLAASQHPVFAVIFCRKLR